MAAKLTSEVSTTNLYKSMSSGIHPPNRVSSGAFPVVIRRSRPIQFPANPSELITCVADVPFSAFVVIAVVSMVSEPRSSASCFVVS